LSLDEEKLRAAAVGSLDVLFDGKFPLTIKNTNTDGKSQLPTADRYFFLSSFWKQASLAWNHSSHFAHKASIVSREQ